MTTMTEGGRKIEEQRELKLTQSSLFLILEPPTMKSYSGTMTKITSTLKPERVKNVSLL